MADTCSIMLQDNYEISPQEADSLLSAIRNNEKIPFYASGNLKISDRLQAIDAIRDRGEPLRLGKLQDLSSRIFSSSNRNEQVSEFIAALTGVVGRKGGLSNSIGTKQATEGLRLRKRIAEALEGLAPHEQTALVRDPKFGDDVARELFDLDPKKSSTGNEYAHRVAKAFAGNGFGLIRRLQQVGAAIFYRQNHIASQYHPPHVLRKMGFERWARLIRDKLEPDTFGNRREPYLKEGVIVNGDILDAEARSLQELKEVYDSIVNGNGKQSFEVENSVLEGLTFNRILQFKDADSWMQYQKYMGTTNMFDSIFETQISLGKRTVLLEGFGSNPEKTFGTLISMFEEKHGKLTALEEYRIMSRWREVSGKMDEVGNPTLGNFSSNLTSWHIATKMGMSGISALADVPIMASVLNSYGKGFAAAYLEIFKNVKRFMQNPKAREEMRVFMVGTDSLMGAVVSRLTGSSSIGGNLHKMSDFVVRFSGLGYVTDVFRTAFSYMTSSHLAGQLNRSWDNVSLGLRTVLEEYGITKADWDLMRSIGAADSGMTIKGIAPEDLAGEKLFTPEMLRIEGKRLEADGSASKEVVARYYEVARKLEDFFSNESRIAIPEPGSGERALMYGGYAKGTVPRTALEQFMLFKSHTFALYNQTYRRVMNGEGSVASHLVPALAIGYAVMSIKDIFYGRELSEIDDPMTWVRAGQQSGVFGIMGSFTGDMASNYGIRPVEYLGPSAETFADMGELMTSTVESEDVYKFMAGNVPGGTLPIIQAVYNNIMFEPFVPEQGP